ncbi:MAG: DUF4358 domain-containing protein [Oscillospiraceae bacterium]|nr:DUF4358 domain-containing protein [Oscillospiraceae bacterium]
MKKRIFAVVLAVLALTVCLCSCKSEEGKTPATADVAAAINNSGEFEELIALTEDNISRRYYGIDLEAIEEFEVLVCSSGAMADEIAVFKMKEKDDVEDMREVVLERKQELYDSFVDYVPEEISKIENAIISSNGNYVYFIVCDDRDAAKKAAEGCF